MLTKNYVAKIVFTGLMIFVILACNLPGGETPQAVKTPSMTSLALPTKPRFTPTSTNTPLSPEQNLDDTLTFGGAATATVTPTPPLPDFEDVLTFGGAGAMPGCEEDQYPPNPNTISAYTSFGKGATLCFFLWKMNFAQPFRIILTQSGGTGMRLESNDLMLDQSNERVLWQGYQSAGIISTWTSDGSVFFSLSIGWPIVLPPGGWKIAVTQQGGFQVSSEFWVQKETSRSYINVLDKNSTEEIAPYESDLGVQNIRLKDNGGLDVVGQDFPPDIPVYLLLYRNKDRSLEYELIYKTVTISDQSGSVAAKLSTFVKEDPLYLVYAITDPNTNLGGTDFVSCDQAMGQVYGAACDYFRVVPSDLHITFPPTNIPASNSCPGAPAQRMVVNQRGYVCTKNDAVRLRASPSRSAGTIVQLDKGTQFTVVGGPSCADNWSWWQVKTDFGQTGWISEGGDETDPYFICPNP